MRILFLTQYFAPETGASQNRLGDLSRRLSALGHRVTVLTALPNYPKGEFYEGYRGRLVMNEDDHGIRIVRTWLYTTKTKSFLRRVLNYLSFSILSVFVGLLAVGRVDVVYVDSPPLFLGVSGYLLAKLKRAMLVLNVADLWPESAVALGMLRNPRLIHWATGLEEGLYRRCCLVTGQTEGIIDSIRRRCPATPVELLTNGVSSEFIAQIEAARTERECTRKEFGFDNRFIVVYTGVHGLAQGLETVLSAAQILDGWQDIRFVLLGDGPEKPRLQALVAEREQHNVEFLPQQVTSRMPLILTAVDASVVPLKRDDLFKGALPSKLFEALGAGVPVIAAMDGEARKLVEQSGGGLVVEPENPESMAEAILQLYHDPVLRKRLGERGRSYVACHYDRKVIAERFEGLLLRFAPRSEDDPHQNDSPLKQGSLQGKCSEPTSKN
jgi:glycosyltransferase involved in cell wall biosynthesis